MKRYFNIGLQFNGAITEIGFKINYGFVTHSKFIE